ncbi:MAG: hypothetical protein HQM14_03325 [SAR324 cluster bacterium]|nr:hypothetical protein [SAR324 cluster bacterium]
MPLKRFLLCLILAFSMILPVYGQDAAEEAPAEEAPAEEAPAEEAAPSGGGGGGSSDMLYEVGALYTLMIGGTSDTDAIGIGEGEAFFPRLGLLFGFDGFSIGGELLIDTSFTVQATGGLSSSGIADSELQFSGMTYSAYLQLDDMIGDGFGLYLGYGLNQFDVSNSLSSTTSTDASNAGIVFEQDIKAQSGTQIIIGSQMEMGESVYLTADLRMIMVPVELTTRIRTIGTSTTTSTVQDIDLDFTIITLGASYNF